MRYITHLARAVALVTLFLAPMELQAQANAQAKIDEALSAAPPAISEEATVMDWDQSVLREGSNGWTCLPRLPGAAEPNPMCADDPWVRWALAYASQTPPQVTRLGINYMLAGDAPVNNDDPFDATPDPGETWVDAGRHIMLIVPDASTLEGISTDPGTGEPWVMWKGTPYVHLMVPVEGEVTVR